MVDDRISAKAGDMYSACGTSDEITIGMEVVEGVLSPFVTLCNIVPEMYGVDDVEGALLLVLDSVLDIGSEGESVEGKVYSPNIDIEEDSVLVDAKTTEVVYVVDAREVSLGVSDTLVTL